MLYDDLTSLCDTDGPYIRLLALFPRLPLQCQLRTYPLNAAPTYEALSYVWGSKSKGHTIICNDSDIAITPNLVDALLRLRHSNSPRVLWVDSICINQEDVLERTQQVLIMRNIYEQASRVVVFPGLLDKFGTTLPSLLSRLANESCQIQQGSDIDGSPPKVKFSEFWAMMAVLDQPWWNRIWVVQEVLVAREVVVLVGKEYVPWLTLTDAFYSVAQISPKTRPPTKHMFMLMMHKHMTSFLCIEEMRKELDALRRDATAFCLLDLLVKFRGFDATDPRDKVYALLGLAAALMPDSELQPDYRKSLEQCYVDTALAIVNQNRNLDIFNSPSRLFNTTESYPSWVPTWISRTSLSKQTPYERSMISFSGTSEDYSWCSASASTTICYPITLHEQRLPLSGIIVDRIQELTDELLSMRVPVNDGDEPHLLPFLMDQIITFFGAIYDIGATMDVLYQWKQMINSSHRYWNANQLFYWIVTGGANFEDPEENYKLFIREWWRFYVSSMIINKLRLWRVREVIPHAYHWLLAGCWYLLRVKWPVAIEAQNYRLGRTDSGLVGLVPVLTKVGDKLALLAGGKTPYVVRRSASHWQFIGHSLVAGMMHGEMWNIDDCHQMEFI